MRILRGKWALSLVFGPARGPDRVAPIANDLLEVGRFVDDFEMPLAAPLARAPFFERRIVGGHVASKRRLCRPHHDWAPARLHPTDRYRVDGEGEAQASARRPHVAAVHVATRTLLDAHGARARGRRLLVPLAFRCPSWRTTKACTPPSPSKWSNAVIGPCHGCWARRFSTSRFSTSGCRRPRSRRLARPSSRSACRAR